MSNTLKHGFTSAKADDVDTSLIQPSHWNAEHVFSGGALGSLLYRDTGSTDGANWLADVAVGQVLVSGGVGAAPAFSATPSLTDLTLSGVLKLANGSQAAPSLTFSSDTDTGFFWNSDGTMIWTTNGANRFSWSFSNFGLRDTGLLAWSATSSVTGTFDVFLARDAAGVLAQRNGANGQTFRIYNTFTDASNYERGFVRWNANALEIGAEQAGTGTNRNVSFLRGGTTIMNFSNTRLTALTGIDSTSPTAGIGYATGAGGTVTQATSKATGVTLSKVTGQITLNAAALAADTTVSFVLTNTAIAAGDVLILNHISAGTPGSYTLNARSAAGSATIDVRNVTTGSLSEAIVISFAVLKAVTA